MKSFGSKDLIKCVKSLGFTFDSISSSHHEKYYPPRGKIPPQGHRPFFTIQSGRKTFDQYSANRYISQLKRFGYTKEEIQKKL